MVSGHRFAVLDQDVPKKALGFFAIWRRIYSSNNGVFLPDSNVFCLKVKSVRRIAFLDFLPSDFGFAKPWAVRLVQASLKYPELYRAGKEKMYMILVVTMCWILLVELPEVN